MKKKEFKIYVFRHGQTYYNRDKIFTGWKDPKLTPRGLKQAEIIAKKLMQTNDKYKNQITIALKPRL